MDPMDSVVAKLNSHAAAIKEKVWKVNGPTQCQVLRLDNNYRTKNLLGGEEFFFRGVRRGKRGLILEFTPVDAAEFVQAEFAQGKAFGSFGEPLEHELISALGSGASTFTSAVNGLVARSKRESGLVEAKTNSEPYAGNEEWGSF